MSGHVGERSATLRFDDRQDELNVLFGPAQDVDFDEFLDDLWVSFDHSRHGRPVAIHFRGVSFERTNHWQRLARELVGPTIWELALTHAQKCRTVEEPIAIPEREWARLRQGPWSAAHASILQRLINASRAPAQRVREGGRPGSPAL